jgi:predicted Rossmann-fold nucleotide-binding protein
MCISVGAIAAVTMSGTVQVSVIGSGAEHEPRAELVGRLLAERGCTVVCGGLGGVMAAAARGAKSVTGLGHARNFAVAASGDAVIAVGGSWGTLAEIAYARLLGRPVVIVEPGHRIDGVPRAATPADAVAQVLAALA